MLKNYFKIAFRNLWRKRAYSLINITGLAVGMACCFLIFLYVHFELSYDRFHQKADRIYRVVGDLKSSTETLHWYVTPGPLGRAIKSELPQVQEVTRFITANLVLRKGELKFQETHTIWADSSLFSVFDFPLIYGDPRTALKEPNSIVLSETAALKYFGQSNPVGQHLLLTGRGLPAIVTGLMKDIPTNSHIKADMLVSMSTYSQSMQPGIEAHWGSYLFSTYLVLKPGTDPIALQSKLPALVQKYEGSELKAKNTNYALWLEPLTSIYLHSSYGAPLTGNLDNVHILTIIGIFESIAYPFWLLILAIGIGLLAGGYPALVLSSFKPVIVLKGHFSSGGRGVALRKALVVGQYTISITLIISTLVVYSQLYFMEHQPLGFDKDKLLIVNSNGDQSALAFERDIAAIPAVKGSAFTSAVPGRTYNESGNDVWPMNLQNSKGNMQQINMAFYNADADFLPLYKIKLLAGRNFYKDTRNDSANVLLNKTAALSLGYTEANLGGLIGKRLKGSGDNTSSTVIGVVEDFHFHSLKEPILPLSIQTGQLFWQFLSIKVNTANLPATLKKLAGKWERAIPNRPFNYFFLDEDFDSQYGAEERFGHLFIYFSILALFISSLGLLGLSAYSTLQRTREIGIRKVLGASIMGIVGLLSSDFVKLVVMAFVIACPISWLTMHRWLEGFAYRTTLNGGLFVLAGTGALLIAVVTISTQAIKAALANPVLSLRTE